MTNFLDNSWLVSATLRNFSNGALRLKQQIVRSFATLNLHLITFLKGLVEQPLPAKGARPVMGLVFRSREKARTDIFMAVLCLSGLSVLRFWREQVHCCTKRISP